MVRFPDIATLTAIASLAVFPAMAQSHATGALGSTGHANAAATSGANGTSTSAMVNTDNNTTAKVTADHQLRSSKIIGSTVYDEHNNSIGSVDDILLSQAPKGMSGNERVANVVLSVGGFVGIGTKLVEVPYSRLKINNEGHIVLPGATKDGLKAMNEYRYNNA